MTAAYEKAPKPYIRIVPQPGYAVPNPFPQRAASYLAALRDAPQRRTAMIFRQLFDQTSGTYSYPLASRGGGETLILDPVLEKIGRETAKGRD